MMTSRNTSPARRPRTMRSTRNQRPLWVTLSGRAVAAGRVAAALALATLALGLGGGAQPPAIGAESTSPITTATIDGSTFTMTTSTPAIPTDTGVIDYRIAVRPATNATSIQLRLKLSTENGTLVFSRTRYLNNLSESAGQLRVEQFTREVSELRLKPGTYQVVCEIAVATASHRTEDALRDHLVVYDPYGPQVLLAPTLRVTAPPMRTPGGLFTVDPASPEALDRLDAVGRLATWVTGDQQSAVTLAISPLLIEEWADIADGYAMAGSEETADPIRTESADPTPRRYALVLTDLLTATESGRLTITAAGYADPSITALASLNREGDILAQYGRGALVFASDEVTETAVALVTALSTDPALTAPLATTVTDGSLDALAQAGIDTVVLPTSAVAPTGASGAGAPQTILGHASGLTAVIADPEISAALGSESSPRSALLAALNARLSSTRADASVASLTEFGGPPARTTATLSRLAELSNLPWVQLVGMRDLGRPTTDSSLTLAPLEPVDAPWGNTVDPTAVNQALDAATAAQLMTSGVNVDNASAEDAEPVDGAAPRVLTAVDSALIAQVGDPTTGSSLRTAYAERAQSLADRVIGAVKLSVRSVTLPSVEGEVPITIVNEGEAPLMVRLEFDASDGLTFIGSDSPERIREEVLLEAGETFRKPAVALHNNPKGTLSVRVVAGSYVLTEESVDVGASYINMIATVGLVVLAGLALVAYVYSRVRRAPVSPNMVGTERANGEPRQSEERP